MTTLARPASHLPLQVLRDTLLATVDLLERRRAGDVGAGLLDDYVNIRWLEWNGGALRLTVAGEAVRLQLTDRLAR